MTKLEIATKKAVIEFYERNKKQKVLSVRHIYPRCYVLSRAAGSCLLVAMPPVDAEPHIQEIKENMKSDGGHIVNFFDDSLKAGDWCSCAYVSTLSQGQSVAVKAVS